MQRRSSLCIFTIAVAFALSVCFMGVSMAYAAEDTVKTPEVSNTQTDQTTEEQQPVVKHKPKPSLKITRSKSEIKAGKTFQFKAKAQNITGKITWEVTNKDVAKITKKGGLFTAKTYGATRVIAKAGNKKASFRVKVLPKRIVCLDPGHQGVPIYGSEQVAPGSGTWKIKGGFGTIGTATRVPEYVLNLNVANRLKDILYKRGYKVVMTRTTHNKAISNIQRAQIANKANADIFIRIHADGAGPGATGASSHCISKRNRSIGYLAAKCSRLSRCILDEMCAKSGAKNRGVVYRDDLTGSNWAKMPVTLIELGFMTNRGEDIRMNTPSYQQKLAVGMANGVDRYFGYLK